MAKKETAKTKGVIMRKSLLILTGVLSLAAFQEANAVFYSFTRITSNNNPDVSSQLSVDVFATTLGSDAAVAFRFFNNVGVASGISEIYFDDGFLNMPATITDSDGGGNGVAYTAGPASPGNLPGGNSISPAFVATSLFSADSTGNPSRTVNAAGEWVQLAFKYGPPVSGDNPGFANFDEVIDALENGNLRIGLHLRAIGPREGSDSYVNVPNNTVPDGGGTLALLGLGLAGIGAWSRQRKA